MKKIIIPLFILSILVYLFKEKYGNKISSDKFQSHRLGNVIDLWYVCSKFKHPHRINSLKEKDPKNINKESFSQYLMNNLKVYQNTLEEENSKKLSDSVKTTFLTYYYDKINLCINDFHTNLLQIMKEYDNLHNNILFNQKFQDENHCVIHFRLGDYVSLGDVINYQDIIDTMKDLKIKFSVIEIMDGGKNHKTSMFYSWKTFKNRFSDKELSESEKISQKFHDSLRKSFPESKIIQSEKRTSDEDFYRMSSAPILITAGGSYAITAAIASTGRIIRTPSCKTLDFPSQGCREDLIIPKNNCDWKTYQYTML